MEDTVYCIRCQADDDWREATSTFRASPKATPVQLCRLHLEQAKAHAFNQAMERKYGKNRLGEQLKLF